MNKTEIFLENIFTQCGINENYVLYLSYFTIIVLSVLVCLIAKFITQKILINIVNKFVLKTKNQWDDILLANKFFSKIALLVPAVIIYFFSIFFYHASFVLFLHKIIYVYLIIVVTLILNTLLTSISDIYLAHSANKNKPIKAYIQTVKIFLYLITGILVIAELFNRNPMGLITGIGAATAIILLIFKDTILGLVASFQLSAQKMVCIGDWIEMPTYGADGDVIDITLNTVKVQNWDKTISMIPTHALISNSFKNWNGMENAGGRRIKRSIYIDMTTIKFCDEKMLQKFTHFEYLKDYVNQKNEDITTFNNKMKANTDDFLINGRHLTNIGCFREYIKKYLYHHPKIHNEMTFLIRQLEPAEKGLPMQIYVFTNDIAWANYEGIQSDIFDHIFAIIAEFELKIYQLPMGKLG